MSLASLDTYSLSYVLYNVDGKLIYNLFCCGSVAFNAKLAQTELDLKIGWDSTPLMLSQACAWLTSISKRVRSFNFQKPRSFRLMVVGEPVGWSIYPKSLLHLSVPSELTPPNEELSQHLPQLVSYSTYLTEDVKGDWIPSSLTSLSLEGEPTTHLNGRLLEILPPTLRHLKVHQRINYQATPSLRHLPLESVSLDLHSTLTTPYDWTFLPLTVVELGGQYTYIGVDRHALLAPPVNFAVHFPSLKQLELPFKSVFNKLEDGRYVFGFPNTIESLIVNDVPTNDKRSIGDLVAESYGHLLHSIAGNLILSAHSALKYCFALRDLNISDFEPLQEDHDISGLELSPGVREEAQSASVNMFGTTTAALSLEEKIRLQPLIINRVTSHFAHIRKLSITWTPEASEAKLLPRTLEILSFETKMLDNLKRTAPIEPIPLDHWPPSLTQVDWLISAIELADSAACPPMDLGLLPLPNLVVFALCVIPVGFSSNYSLKMGRFPFLSGDLVAATRLESLTLRLEGFNEDLRALFSSHLEFPRSLTSLIQLTEGALDPELIPNAWDEASQSSYFENLKTLHLGRSTRYPRQPTVALRSLDPIRAAAGAGNAVPKEEPTIIDLQQQHYELAKARRGNAPEVLIPRLPRTLEDLVFVCRPSITSWTGALFASLPRTLRSLCIRQMDTIPFEGESAACVRSLPPRLNTFQLYCPTFHHRSAGLSMSHTACYPADIADHLPRDTYNVTIGADFRG